MTILFNILLLAFTWGCCGSLVFAETQKNPADPFETFNRQIFQFNYDLDRAVYRPVAKLYVKVTHPKVQHAVVNVFNNIDEIPSMANDLLQLDGHHFVINTWRLIINSTVGILGIFDVASHLGLPPYRNDFGLTLYKWGVKKSPYLQIVFLGPSTLRDATGMGFDYALRPLSYISSTPLCYGAGIFRGVPTRAQLLAANTLVDEAIDPYIFVREAYLQKREEDIRKMRAHLSEPKEG